MIRNIFTVGGWTLVSRVTGFLRDVVMAAVLGAGPVADAFLVAFRLPNHFPAILAEGAFNAAFVPAYALNNFLARVPVLGLFLGGGQNEGAFAQGLGYASRRFQAKAEKNSWGDLLPYRKLAKPGLHPYCIAGSACLSKNDLTAETFRRSPPRRPSSIFVFYPPPANSRSKG